MLPGASSCYAGSGERGFLDSTAAKSQFDSILAVCLDPSDADSVICSDSCSVRRIKNGMPFFAFLPLFLLICWWSHV
jgi:hypothetical protein